MAPQLLITLTQETRVLCRILEASGQTIAVAESLTSGRIQALVGSVSGASNFFKGGITAYSLQQKVKHLGVDLAHAESVNSVSDRVASEMALGVRFLFDSSIGLATTGYAEVAPTENIATPFAYVAANVLGQSMTWRIDGGTGNRTAVQDRIAILAIKKLLTFLQALVADNDCAEELAVLRNAVQDIKRSQ